MDRKKLQEKAFKIYNGDYTSYVSAIINKRHESQEAISINSYNSPTRNALRKCANIQSVLYDHPPRRSVYKHPELTAFFKNGIDSLDLVLDEVSGLTIGIGDFFVAPYFDKSSKKIYLDTIAPAGVDVKQSRGKVISITIPLENNTRCEWFADGTFETRNHKDEVVDKGDSELGVLPIAWFRLNPANRQDIWSIQQQEDLISGTILIGVEEAYLRRNSYLGSFKQKVSTGGTTPVGEGNDIGVSPFTVLGRPIEAVDLADPANPFLNTIQKIEADLLKTRGISTLMIDGVASSDEVVTVSAQLKSFWTKSIKIFSKPERDLLRICMSLSNHYLSTSYDLNTNIVIDYTEPGINEDTKSQSLDNLEKSIKLGVGSPVDYILTHCPDVQGPVEALEIVLTNIRTRAEVVVLMRKLNITSDILGNEVYGQTLTPAQNGAIGGAVGGKSDAEKEAIIKENSGGNGPLAVSQPYK